VLKGLVAVTSLAVLGAAADTPGSGEQVKVAPIFSELLRLSYPGEFHGAFENTNGNFYIQESVLQGESVERWTQMLTVTGTKGLSLNPQATPERFVERIARGFRSHCPDSFSQTPLADEPLAGHDSYGAILACGSVADPEGPRSEVALIVAFRGRRDYYTIQWAERGAPAAAPVVPVPQWLARWQRLAPIRTCPILEGEGPPYVSCSAAASPSAAPPAPDSNQKERS
jgi:hypothetical protein